MCDSSGAMLVRALRAYLDAACDPRRMHFTMKFVLRLARIREA